MDSQEEFREKHRGGPLGLSDCDSVRSTTLQRTVERNMETMIHKKRFNSAQPRPKIILRFKTSATI